MKRLGQISVVGVAALAIWLALPSAEEPASVGREPSRSDARDAAVHAPTPDARRPASRTARLERDPAVPAGPSLDATGRGETSGASEAGAADRYVDDRTYRTAVGAAVPPGDPTSRDSLERTRSDTGERSEVEESERVRRTVRTQHRGSGVDPVVERDVSDGSVTPEHLDGVGDEAPDPSVEEEDLLERLARAGLPEDASEEEVRRQRELVFGPEE